MNIAILKRILTLSLFAIICSYSKAQPKKDSVPHLFRFFQHNFDTTIIWEISSNWISTELPRYDIVATKDGRTFFFTYKNPYPFISGWPKSLSAIFSRENLAFTSFQPDTNRYLFPVRLSFGTDVQIKKSIDSLSMWTIRDDKADRGADWSDCKAFISDAGSDNFYLITFSDIKKLSFYAPEYYEQQCKPRDGRQRILRVINVLKGVFYNKFEVN